MNPFLQIEELLAKGTMCGTTRLITIDGRAGSGKTTLAEDLHLHLQVRWRVEVIHLDDLYPGWTAALGAHLTNSLTRIVGSLEKGEPVSLNIFNWSSGEFDSLRSFTAPEILIIEGVGSGQSSIRDSVAVTIWMEIGPEIGLKRVLERDGDQISTHMQEWQVMEVEHFKREATREGADFIFSTE